MKKKMKEWLKRYLPAEAFAIIGAIIGAGLVFLLTNNRILSAYAGAICDGIVFYTFILIRDLNNSKKKHGTKEVIRTIRNLVIEFGFSEFLDLLIIRPFIMYIFPLIIGHFAIGIFIGKIVADLIFYLPTIIMYELRKKHLK